MYKCPICGWSPPESSYFIDPQEIIQHERTHKHG